MNELHVSIMIDNDSLKSNELEEKFHLRFHQTEAFCGWQPNIKRFEYLSLEDRVESCVNTLELIQKQLLDRNELLQCTINVTAFQPSLELDPKLLERIGKVGATLFLWLRSVEFRELVNLEDLTSFDFPGPTFFSNLDEDQFFRWLKEIKGVVDVRGSLTDLVVFMNSNKLTESSLREFVALFKRYNISADYLKPVPEPKNFRDA